MNNSENLSTLGIMHEGRHRNSELAAEVLNACKIKWEVPDDRIAASVENGWVTLAGVLDWPYQCVAAIAAVNGIEEVKGVYNHLTINPPQQDFAEIRI